MKSAKHPDCGGLTASSWLQREEVPPLCFPRLSRVKHLSHMGNFLEQDLQRNHRPSLMYPNDSDDVCDSLGTLISHLEAIWYVNHQQQHPTNSSRCAGGQQPDLLSLLHSRHRGRQRIEGSRLRKEEEEGEQVKRRRCCWRTGGWGPGEADQIGALKISRVGALWRPNG